MATTGTTKTATIGKQLSSATTEDGSGFYNVDTSARLVHDGRWIAR